jgi:hypothetical protein
MQRDSLIDRKATIYHYQLIRKFAIRKEMIVSHLIGACLLAAFQFLMYGVNGLMSWTIGLLGIPIIHYVILRLTMKRVDEPEDRRWNWRFAFPWIGYVPIQMVEHGLFRKLHWHLMWFGLCAIAVFYPWASESFMISLICWHFWFLAPRLFILRLFRKARRDGVIKLLPTEVSVYHR